LEQLLEERSRALVSAEEQIRTLFENSPLGIALSSFDGRFLSVNEALVMMLRASREELLESNVTDFYLEPSDRSALLTKVQEFGSVQNFGVRLIRSDGSDFFASFNLSRLVLEDEEVLLAIIEDVTDEITAEQEAATLEERERLARELHDAVTQTLFSAGVLAQALPLMLKKDPVIAQQNFERLSILINGALAEMRTLILEQRPSELKEQDIFQLLGLLVESMRARTRATISLNVEESCSPSEEVAICLYRIAQEALNNVVRHAMASEVIVELWCDDEDIKFSVRDDGQGFNQREIRAGHFGISIMQERAESVGAKMDIASRIGEGTEVIVSWPAPGEQNDHE
jgi:PAS domain S-box-containing protein